MALLSGLLQVEGTLVALFALVYLSIFTVLESRIKSISHYSQEPVRIAARRNTVLFLMIVSVSTLLISILSTLILISGLSQNLAREQLITPFTGVLLSAVAMFVGVFMGAQSE